uniref:probable pectinesterase/pectinesterase inhibitor 41 n=1 Tax=Erigeron canadensis TaxID=72917 RepID=UPI001CB8BDE5|nr:probable pectinesterase/pectinesterase inhibitor 41 [Erigeron canadensis]
MDSITVFFSFLILLLTPSSSLLTDDNSTDNVYENCRFSFLKSLSAATKFANLVDNYLRSSSGLTVGAINALEDCQYLARLNIDFLSTCLQTINSTQTTSLPGTKIEDTQSILSAILTDTETCVDGLKENAASWTSKNGIISPIRTDDKLYSTSLALFNKGWGSSKKGKRIGFSHRLYNGFKNGKLPTFKMSQKPKTILENVGDQIVVSNSVVVSQDGTGNFTKITDAVNSAPNNSDATAGYFVIYVRAGLYEEYVNIPKSKKYLMMIGDGINQTVITGNRSVVDGSTTFRSATFIVVSPYFVGVNLTIRNTAGAIKHQAVALRNSADLSTFYSCSFEGYQDTLYAHSLRQFYRECDIYGTVDFIFGNAAAVFQNCNIYPRLPMSGQFNAITAQGRTDPGQNTGTSIQRCNIRAADDLAASNGTTVTYLGRPWKEYSRTVYMQSYMDSLITPAGWSIWSGDFALNTSYYAEFNNSGPGSDTSSRVTWPGFHVIDATEAVNFTVSTFILGDEFLPQTGVPYDGGL